MKNYLERLPEELKQLIYAAQALAAENNISAYLVGGFVRDLILAVKNFDLDIVVEASGIRFAEGLSRKLNARLTRHSRFGTAVLFTPGRIKLDIATARKEIYPQPAALPIVTPSNLKDDLYRRDFTINALAIDISREGFGRLIDYFGAADDLRQKKIRVLHDLSFIDDPTRILRAVRFEQRLTFRIESHTLRLLQAAVASGMLQKVQPQRLRDELILLLKEPQPLKAVKRLNGLKAMGFIGPRLSVDKRTERLFKAVARQASWFAQYHHQRRQPELWLVYLMALLDGLSRQSLRSFCRRFVLRKGEEKRLLDYQRLAPKLLRKLDTHRLRYGELFFLLEPLSYEAILMLKAKAAGVRAGCRIEEFFRACHGVRLEVSGDDLCRLGLRPGPVYQKIFSRLLKAKLERGLKSRADELRFLRTIIR